MSFTFGSPQLSTPPLTTPDASPATRPWTRASHDSPGSVLSNSSSAQSIPIFLDGEVMPPLDVSNESRGLGFCRDVSMPDDISMRSGSFSQGGSFSQETPRGPTRVQPASLALSAALEQPALARMSVSTEMSRTESSSSSDSTKATSVVDSLDISLGCIRPSLLPPVDLAQTRSVSCPTPDRPLPHPPAAVPAVEALRQRAATLADGALPPPRPRKSPSRQGRRTDVLKDEHRVQQVQQQLFGDYRLTTPTAVDDGPVKSLRHAKSHGAALSGNEKALPRLPRKASLSLSPLALAPPRPPTRPAISPRSSHVHSSSGAGTSQSTLNSPSSSIEEKRKLSLIIDQEGFREVEATFSFVGVDVDQGMLDFRPAERLACPFHYASLQAPPVLRRLLVDDSGDRDFLTRQASLTLRKNAMYAVEGSEEREKRWRFVYEVEDRTSLMGKILPGEKCLIPLAFSCTPDLLDHTRSRRNKLLRVFKNSVAPKLTAARVSLPSSPARSPGYSFSLSDPDRSSVDSPLPTPSSGRSRLMTEPHIRSAKSSASSVSTTRSGDELAHQQRAAFSQLGEGTPPSSAPRRSRTSTVTSSVRTMSQGEAPILVLATPLTPLVRPPSRHTSRSQTATTITEAMTGVKGRKRGMSEAATTRNATMPASSRRPWTADTPALPSPSVGSSTAVGRI